ncbi:MAG: helix-turn-helix transcriptional regulator [Lachnospiraceae bacterium]|nr:helix-turn-helix transcriptional regulator [Lachnospiraceae bacterium]
MKEDERIKYLRKEVLHLSQEEFGSRLGVTKMAISKIESGSRNLTDQMLTSICREYRVREEWLRTGSGEMFEPNPESELDALCDRYGLSRQSRAFIRQFVELREDEQDVIMKYVLRVADDLRGEEPTAPSVPSDADLHADLQKELDLQKRRPEGSTGSSSTAV